MPLLKRQTLADALKSCPRSPVAKVVRIGREIAEGLAAAQDRGLVHAMLVGHPPFRAASTTGLLLAVQTTNLPPPSQANPHVPPFLNDLVMRPLTKTPGERPASAHLVAEALQATLPAAPEQATTEVWVSSPAVPQPRAARRRPHWGWLIMVAVPVLMCRRLRPSARLHRIEGWRWYVPMGLLPVEWLLPPALIALRIGEIEADWWPVRVAGLAIGLAGAVLLVWASVLLGRFLMHEAAVREDHALVVRGPCRIVRHPVNIGYLALLLGSGLASLNVCLLLLWPVSLLGILIQASSEELLLGARFGREHERYAGRVGRLVPRFGNRVAEPSAEKGVGSRFQT